MSEFKLYLGDCLEYMRNMATGSIDAAITSPPYGVAKEYETQDSKEQLNELLELLDKTFENMARIIKPGGYFFVNFGDNSFGKKIYGTEVQSTIPMSIYYFSIGSNHGFELQATRIWRKPFGAMKLPFFLNYSPRPVFDYEHLWTWRKPDGVGKEKVNDHKISRHGVWATSPNDDEFQGGYEAKVLNSHCAAFPVKIPHNAIVLYSDKNDTIFDPFMGSGTTGVAALQLERNFIGCEINSEYYIIAKKRIEQIAMQPLLFSDLKPPQEKQKDLL